MNTKHIIYYKGRTIRYQRLERVWVFNILNSQGKWERRVHNTLRAAKAEINKDMAKGAPDPE
ncbi:MAG TPA: hypothetical protein VK673_21920 [Chthoniobacterales bacterium]|nr:hypothetical protein [Chthoniobacterales bacterium]